MSRRTARVNELLRETISDLLRNEAKDPRLVGLFSVTQVEVAPDLRSARVWVSVLGTEEEKQALLDGLQHVSPFIQRELGARLRMRHTPTVDFRLDERIARAAEILRLMDEVAPRDQQGRDEGA